MNNREIRNNYRRLTKAVRTGSLGKTPKCLPDSVVDREEAIWVPREVPTFKPGRIVRRRSGEETIVFSYAGMITSA